jgi:hypothetical protein
MKKNEFIKILRKPQYAVCASLFMLFFSCSQYEIRNETIDSAFDSEILNAFRKGEIEMFVNTSNNSVKSLKNSKNLLAKVNNHYGTDLKIHDDFFQLYLDGDKNEITETSLRNGWLNQKDINLANELVENINTSGFDSAIEVFKNQTLKLNLSKEEFSKKNTFVNIMQIMHEENPDFFQGYSFQQRAGWSCFWASVVFVLSFISVLSCVTIILCGFALYGLMGATDNLVAECN